MTFVCSCFKSVILLVWHSFPFHGSGLKRGFTDHSVGLQGLGLHQVRVNDSGSLRHEFIAICELCNSVCFLAMTLSAARVQATAIVTSHSCAYGHLSLLLSGYA